MMRISGYVMLAALVCAAPAAADPILNLVPPSGLAAAPGETVGWGYEIINDDPTQWLVVTSLIPDGFQHGTGSDAIFTFPIVAPAPDSTLPQTLTVPYVPGLQGLYEFTWNLTAPGDFTNSGLFHIDVEFWSGDPFVDGQPVSSFVDFFVVPYSVTVTVPPTEPPPTSVPEPATLLLLSSGLALAGLLHLRRSA